MRSPLAWSWPTGVSSALGWFVSVIAVQHHFSRGSGHRVSQDHAKSEIGSWNADYVLPDGIWKDGIHDQINAVLAIWRHRRHPTLGKRQASNPLRSAPDRRLPLGVG